MNPVRLNADSCLRVTFKVARVAYNKLVSAYHHYIFIVNPLEYFADDFSLCHALSRAYNAHILRTDDNVNLFVERKIVHTFKNMVEKTHSARARYGGAVNIALTDKIRNKRVFGLVVNFFGRSYLLNRAVLHNNNRVRQRERLLLVMRYIYKGNSELFMHFLKLKLHVLAHFKVKRTERLVKQKNLRLVHDGACNCDSLLLTAGKR